MKNGNKSTSSISFDSALQIAFIVLKLCGKIDWSWFWVLAPTWIAIAFVNHYCNCGNPQMNGGDYMILDSNLDIGVYYDPLHRTASFMGEVWEEVAHIDAIPFDVVKLVARAGRYYFYLAYDRDTPGEIRPGKYFVIGD